nr:DUF262 domain-containing protein [Candidatus Sigynarchaeota archaeon]
MIGNEPPRTTNEQSPLLNVQQQDEVETLDEELDEKENDDEDIFLEKYKEVRFDPVHPTIQTLYNNYKDGDLILHPPYQRNFVWNKQKASNLIESILLNIPIPVIYTLDNGVREEVIDGQQRLRSVFSFIEGKFPSGDGSKEPDFKLSNLKILKELSGKRYRDLDKENQRTIMKRTLSIIQIKTNKDDFDEQTIKFEMFERLNTNITKLNAQELRNCMYRGKYNDLLKALASLDDFQHILNAPRMRNRMLDVELVLMFATMLHAPLSLYKGNMKQLMNTEMIKNQDIAESESRTLASQFKKSVSLVKTIFGQHAFRLFAYNPREGTYGFDAKFNQGLYISLMLGFVVHDQAMILPFSDIIREA